jgi:transcriptional regulator GlxA family with amidase domain
MARDIFEEIAERVRVETARFLESATAPIETIALLGGFESTEAMRQAFVRILGVGPAGYRARFQLD